MKKPGHPPQKYHGPRVAHPKAPKDKATHWGEVADWYDTLVGDEGSEYHREVIIPGILRMLAPREDAADIKNQKSEIKNSLDVIDLACGQGVLCRRLAKEGHRVLGVDAAETLIKAAQTREAQEPLGIRYAVGDATKLRDAQGKFIAPLSAASVDVITIILAIQNITPLSPVWHACREMLRPGGHLILVMMHPCFRIPKQSDWLWEDATSTQARLVRQYLSSAPIQIQTHPGLAAHGKDENSTTHFHRPLQAYINTLGNAGLLIDHIEEWTSHKTSQPGPRQAGLDKARKEIPMFLAVRARRMA